MLDCAQFGFTLKEKAVTQAAALVEVVDRHRLLDKETHLCFVDLAKAYDSVPHEAPRTWT